MFHLFNLSITYMICTSLSQKWLKVLYDNRTRIGKNMIHEMCINLQKCRLHEKDEKYLHG